jgi:hypothetical protein|tara:strand:- start:362 stop:1120 length:759 start_codon:yes stop_codon:yes gene_type:complete
MSLKKLMADNSFALVNNTMWIGIPKVATSSLYPVFKNVSTTYYNDNEEFLNNSKNNNINKLWCIWRDPWERWLSAVIQDYEYKFDLGIVRNGVKQHRDLTDKELSELYNELTIDWKFSHLNLKNRKFQHSGIYLARYITLLWKLINERFNCQEISFYTLPKIEIAIKENLNIELDIPKLNVSNVENTHRLGVLLKEKDFYGHWKNQYQEDLNLNKVIDKNKRSTRFGYDYWNNNILYVNKSRYNKIPIGKMQ